MLTLYAFIEERPRLAAVLSALALLDLSNCIRLGHADWPIPAAVALAMAALVKPR